MAASIERGSFEYCPQVLFQDVTSVAGTGSGPLQGRFVVGSFSGSMMLEVAVDGNPRGIIPARFSA